MDRRKFLTGAAVGGAAVAVSAPAIAQKRKEMAIVSTWPKGLPGLGVSAERLAARIPVLTEGRIVTTYYESGKKADKLGEFDHVRNGDSEAYIGADYYWKGKHPGLAYFTAVPFGLTFAEMDAWMRFGGGQELYDKLTDQFGLKSLPCGNTGVQMGGWFRKEIEAPEDLAELKMRIPGFGGDVMSKLGVATQTLAGGDIYKALQDNTIDATEWVGPLNDYSMKFFEVAKYYYYPGMHEPGAQLTLGVNKKFWSDLSDLDREILTSACREENINQFSEANARNGAFLKKLTEEEGVELKEFSDELYDAFGEKAQEVFEEVRQHDALTNEIHESFVAARTEIGRWMKLADIAYSEKRNRVLDI